MAHVKVLEKRAAEMSRDHDLNSVIETLSVEVGALTYAQIEAIRCGYYRGVIEAATARIGTYIARFGADVLATLATDVTALADRYRDRQVGKFEFSGGEYVFDTGKPMKLVGEPVYPSLDSADLPPDPDPAPAKPSKAKSGRTAKRKSNP